MVDEDRTFAQLAVPEEAGAYQGIREAVAVDVSRARHRRPEEGRRLPSPLDPRRARRQSQQTPAIPSVLFVDAEMTEATWVPWEIALSSSGSASSLTKS